jgi:putative glutamine amidotransferase
VTATVPIEQQVLVAVGSPEGDKALNYVRALEVAGVPSERIRVIEPEKGVDYQSMGGDCLGLVLAGGEDVEPERYGEDEIPEAEVSVNPERDEMELALLAGAREAETPTWGVCRGIQVINVFFGGTLWQDLALQLPTQVLHQLSNPHDALIHALRVDDPTVTLGSLLARENPLVNSRHHQAVKDLGADLVAVAHAPDGVTEALYLDSPSWWVRGVQWHPENLVEMAQQRALWTAFAEQLGLPGNGSG